MDSGKPDKKSEIEEMASGSSENDSKTDFELDTYLKSFGLVVNDGRPRFKLDEPTTALNTSTATATDLNITDGDDTLSFLILGENSIDAMQTSLLASYVDIQQKSMLVDHSSLISSLNAAEVQEKLSQVLQENVKLKETLKQNNLAMKQRFNTLATWQEEITKIHQNHKQKFAETREFINHLKKENGELKLKLSTQQTGCTEHGFELISAIPESDINDVSSDRTKLEEKISLLTEDLHNSKLDCSRLADDVEQYKNMYNVANAQLEEVRQKIREQEVEVTKSQLMTKSSSCVCSHDSINTAEHQECSICSSKDLQIAMFQQFVKTFAQGLLNAIPSIQLENLCEPSSSQDRQKFIDNIKEYNDRSEDLTKCFETQINRIDIMEKYLKEIIGIVEIICKELVKYKILENDPLEMQLQQSTQELCDCHKKLRDEHVKVITDRQILIKSQNIFHKILMDYNRILIEAQMTNDENTRLYVLSSNILRDHLQKLMELEKSKSIVDQKDRQSLEENIKFFDKEKEDLEEEKKSLERQKESLDKERESLLFEKELLTQEKIDLSKTKASLDEQGRLYENYRKDIWEQEKSPEAQSRITLMQADIATLRQATIDKDLEINEVKKQLEQSTEEIDLLKTQVDFYKEDFQDLKKLKESLLEDKSTLTTELEKHIKHNNELQMEMRVLQNEFNGAFHRSPRRENRNLNDAEEKHIVPQCPICSRIFPTLTILTEHIEKCLSDN